MKKVLLSLVAAIVATVAIAQTEPEPQLRPMQEEEILPSHSVAVSTLEPQPEYKLKNWRIALDVAYSGRIAKLAPNTTGTFTDSEWQEYGRESRHGVAYGVGITGFFNTSAGLGANS